MRKILKSPLLVFAVIAFILAGCTSSAAEKEETDDGKVHIKLWNRIDREEVTLRSST